jgi:hypothetical protein
MKERLKVAVERAGSALVSAARRDWAVTRRLGRIYIAEPSAVLDRYSVQSAYGSGRAKLVTRGKGGRVPQGQTPRVCRSKIRRKRQQRNGRV